MKLLLRTAALNHSPRTYFVGLLARYSELREVCDDPKAVEAVCGLSLPPDELQLLAEIPEEEVTAFRAALEAQFEHVMPYGI